MKMEDEERWQDSDRARKKVLNFSENINSFS